MNAHYGTIEGADAYFAARGNAVWDGLTVADRTAALVRASDYIRNEYVRRLGIPDPDSSPIVEEGTYIAAGIEATKPGFFSATYAAGSAKVLTEVRGIKWEVVGGGSGSAGGSLRPVSMALDALFAGFASRRFMPFMVI